MFRGFTDNWIYGFPWINEQGTEFIIDNDRKMIPVKTDSLTQDTGITDINNNHIYVGDIISYGIKNEYNHIAIIKYIPGRFIACGPYGQYILTDSYLKNINIIGNHIENPDIVESLYNITEEFNRDCFLTNTTYKTI